MTPTFPPAFPTSRKKLLLRQGETFCDGRLPNTTNKAALGLKPSHRITLAELCTNRSGPNSATCAWILSRFATTPAKFFPHQQEARP